MHRVSETNRARTWAVGIAVTAMVVAGAITGSCAFDTKTTFCEQYGLRCKEGQQCAANEPKCIEIGGCGDGNPDNNKDEMCDDGNNVDGDGCSADCKSDETCGNEIVDENIADPEECDHGRLNGTGEDLCDVDCHFRSFVCGNGMIDAEGEQCDPGETDSDNCNSILANMNGLKVGCKLSKCGDAYTNMAAGEQCDTAGVDAFNCNGLFCTTPICGDKITNEAASEQCDNGGSDTVGCNGNNNGGNGPGICHFPACGDGYTNTKFTPKLAIDSEQCDSLGGGDTNTCNGNNGGKNGPGSCRIPSCGDGYTNMAAAEACDNLNGVDADQCNGNNSGSNGPGSCQSPSCGDGYINTKFTPDGALVSENCDNLGGGDTAQCNGNNNGSNGPGSCRMSSCGDGYTNITAGEDCDTLGGSDTFTCNGSSGSASCQTAICGDNHRNMAAGEGCDKGTADDPTCNGSSAGSASCQTPTCGDKYINTQAGEECEDDSDCISPKTCNTSCKCR